MHNKPDTESSVAQGEQQSEEVLFSDQNCILACFTLLVKTIGYSPRE